MRSLHLPRRLNPWRLAVCGALLALAVPASAQWTWRDASGRITASDRPPPREVPEKDILSRPRATRAPVVQASAAASGASAPAGTPVDRDLETRKRGADEEKQARLRAEEQRLAEQRAENCRRARGQQSALDSGQRIARINDKGEREVLDDRGRADELRRAREVIASDCR